MRTTLVIDDDLLDVARALAAEQGLSLGAAVSELMRRGLERGRGPHRDARGFPTFSPPQGARLLTSEVVRQALEDE